MKKPQTHINATKHKLFNSIRNYVSIHFCLLESSVCSHRANSYMDIFIPVARRRRHFEVIAHNRAPLFALNTFHKCVSLDSLNIIPLQSEGKI